MSRYAPEGQRTITESEYHKNQDKKKHLPGMEDAFCIYGKISCHEQYRGSSECGYDTDDAGIDKTCGIEVYDYSGGIEEYAAD